MFDAIPTGLTDEQRMIRDVVRDMARTKLSPLVAETDRTDTFPTEAVAHMAELGLFSLSVPTDYGGLGADVTIECLVVEELAYAFPAAALTICPGIVTAHILGAAGPGPAQDEYLKRLGVPGTLAAVALTEPGAGSDSAAVATRAERVDGGYKLNGSKLYVTNGSVADFYCIFARTGTTEDRARGITGFMVDADTPGLTVGRIERKMGLHGNMTAEMFLSDVFVPDEHVVGEVGKGFRYVMKSFDLSRPVIGVLALGIARSAMEAAAAYAADREQFGQPINAFQGVQFMLADMAISIESARALIYEVARMIDSGHADVNVYAAMAKSQATDVAMQVTTDAVQVFGGAGYTDQFPAERMMRDVKIFQIFEGTNQIQRLIVGRHINNVVEGAR